jgi:hypothetical protein
MGINTYNASKTYMGDRYGPVNPDYLTEIEAIAVILLFS